MPSTPVLETGSTKLAKYPLGIHDLVQFSEGFSIG